MATAVLAPTSSLLTISRLGIRGVSNMTKSARPAKPQWLDSIMQDKSPTPRLYRWTLTNLASGDHVEAPRPMTTDALGNDKRRIHILGIGNLGRLYANSLASTADRPPVTLVVHRKSLLEHWKTEPGVEITRSGVAEMVDDFEIEWWTEEKPSVGPVAEVCNGQQVSNLVVATKAPDALPQVDRLRRYLGEESTVAFVQNGMNKLWPPYGIEYNKTRYPAGDHPNWIVCVTTHGVTSLGTFKSIHASPADVAMGPVSLNSRGGASAQYLMAQIMAAPHLDARKVSRSDLWVLQLEKLIVNSVINPLTAVLRCKNGELFSNRNGSISHIIDILIEEASAVLQALVRDNASHEILLGEQAGVSSNEERQLKLKQGELIDRFSGPRLRAMVYAVGEKVKDNRSSMLQDVTAGKKTEIREFNGWLVDTAEYLGAGLEVINHRTLITLVEDGVVLEESQLGKYFPLP